MLFSGRRGFFVLWKSRAINTCVKAMPILFCQEITCVFLVCNAIKSDQQRLTEYPNAFILALL